jgi:proteasome inhibitor subunit 1 (PI31)
LGQCGRAEWPGDYASADVSLQQLDMDNLDPSALLSSLPALLPNEAALKSSQDALASLVHTIFVGHSFTLIGIDDSAQVSSFDQSRLPGEWNAKGPNHYSLRYSHSRSSLQYLVTITKISDRTLFNAMAIGASLAPSLP